jgi:hypothetical protein
MANFEAPPCYAPRLAAPERGPRKYQMIKPTTGRMTTSTIHSAFFSLDALLPKILMIAHMSATRINRPMIPLNDVFSMNWIPLGVQ